MREYKTSYDTQDEVECVIDELFHELEKVNPSPTGNR